MIYIHIMQIVNYLMYFILLTAAGILYERYNSKFVEIENSQIPLSRNKKTSLTQALEIASS